MKRKQLLLVPFRVSEETIAELKKLAVRSDVSMSEYLRRVADRHVAAQRRKARAA